MLSRREGTLLRNYGRNAIHILSCVLIVWCSVTHALYESGVPSPLVSTSIKEAPRIDILQGSFPSSSQDPDVLVWEYFVRKYSSSGNGLTPEALLRIARSTQKCQKSSSPTGKIDSGHNVADMDIVSLPNKKSGHTSDCNRILESITLSGSAYYNQSSFERICQRLLFLVANPECCLPTSNERLANGFPVESLPSLVSGESGPTTTIFDSRNAAAAKKEKPSSSEVWGYGFLLVTIISCSSLVGVSLMPFMAKDFYKHLLTVMIGLAVGSLTGSAMFHLLPQALRLSENDQDHEYLNISLYIVGGIWLFFMVERILKFIMDYKERKGKSWKREKMSSVLSSTQDSATISVMTENGNLMKGALVEANGGGEQRNSLIFPSTPRDTGVIYECQEQVIKASFGHQEKPRLSSCHDHQVTFEQGKDSVIATVAWMIIFGDGLHNFIDGLSIGAAFNESIWTGVSISLAVLCEELPHELGDFAVLLNAGMSMRQAVTYNFLSACTCYIGMAVGILLGEVEASIYIFALAGGMFLYISLVDMVPEMNEIAQETSKVSVKKGIITLVLQNMGLFAGITALYLLAKYQDSFQF